MLTVRVVVLERSQLHKKAYNLIVCDLGGFKMYCVMVTRFERAEGFPCSVISVAFANTCTLPD